MRFHYHPETDSLYIDLSEGATANSQEVNPGVVLDFDTSGQLVGIDIDRASEIVDLSHPEAEALPVSTVSLSAQEDPLEAWQLEARQEAQDTNGPKQEGIILD